MFINFKVISVQTRRYKKCGMYNILIVDDLKQKSQENNFHLWIVEERQ